MAFLRLLAQFFNIKRYSFLLKLATFMGFMFTMQNVQASEIQNGVGTMSLKGGIVVVK